MKIEVEVTNIADKQLKGIEFEGICYKLEPTQPVTKKKKSKGKYFDKAYQREVTKDEMDAVKKAILHVENNYIPTVEKIANQTGFETRVVQSILHKMKQLDIITSERTKERRVQYSLKE